MNINSMSEAPKPLSRYRIIPKRGSFFELLILAVVSVLFYFFIIAPKAGVLSAQKIQQEALSQKQGDLAAQKANLERLVSQLSGSSADIGKLDQALPLHGRDTWIYLLVDKLAQSSGLAVGNLSVSSPEGQVVAGDRALLQNPFGVQRSLQKVSINLSATGSFDQVYSFLKKLESSGRIMEVKLLQVGGSEGSDLDVDLSFDAYYYGTAATNAE